MQRTDSYIEKIKQNKSMLNRIKRAMPVLSLVVITSVFWTLKLTGITMAGEAFCGVDEHTHDETCGQPPLICILEETEGHYHTDNCIAQLLVCTETETEGHTHAEECFSKTLVCTTEESEGHTHTEECILTTVICTTAEHTHTEACVKSENICNTEETAGHTHTELCYNENAELICTEQESAGHTHTEECTVSTVVCTLEEHNHNEECVTEETICTLEEAEGHQHGEECYTSEVICTTEESEGHTHSAECYIRGTGFICQPQENEEHIHTVECIGEETQLCCEMEIIEPHTHDETCYGPAEECQLEEHTHTSECYSDINADVETPEQWEATISGIVQYARPQDNLVSVAKSQLGYAESTKNYQVDENGDKNGYTRYGQWYGNPYGQWNTMFVSFCMHYSQFQGIPLSAGAETMRVEWESIGIYYNAQDIQPLPGDIIFLDKNANGAADAVAIITAYQDGNITVVEGDLDNMVAETTYADTDTAIMGYGVVPNINMIMTLEEDIEPTAEEEITGTYLADVTEYNTNLFSNNQRLVIYTQYSDGKYYAIDVNGNAVRVKIDEDGNIYTDSTNINSLLWTFTKSDTGYKIKNVSANRYLHPFYNNANDHGLISGTDWVTLVNTVTTDGTVTGITLQGRNQRACAYQESATKFVESETASTVFRLGKVGADCTVWLDGTNGGIRAYYGAQTQSFTVKVGQPFILTDECTGPTKYGQALKGWYDVTNSKYYPIGAKVEITGNTVFYAYWEAETYDIGVYNELTVNTVSSNEFITTNVFDYGYLFNVLSSNPTVTVNNNSHSETWNFVTGTGTVKYNNNPDIANATTLDYAFVDRTGSGKLSEPNNLNSYNGVNYQQVHLGLMDEQLRDILFSTENAFDTETGEGIIGKTHLGEGDHLFQYISDPNDPKYGYYYYDSELNAASYNQSKQRFYVYDYLSKTSDSNSASSGYADFLPFNSPYANLADSNVSTYSYNGANGEYNGITHYNYEIGSSSGVMANMAYGMSIDVKFHLSYKPGEKDDTGEYGNMDIFGNEMNFEFAGDDDLWVYIDDVLVLDLGGIHQSKDGSINFTTGEVTVTGSKNTELTNALKSLPAGEHVMHVYYLERGSSQSNCSMYFNISPRYSLNLSKEDVLTEEALDGTEFAIYTDAECKNLAELWTSKESYVNEDEPALKFKVENGSVDIWGLSAGSTYYIKEVTPPEDDRYEQSFGIIKFIIGKSGIATYDVIMLEETDEDGEPIPVSPGFTVHGVRIDEGNQKAYMTVTNAQKWVEKTTTVQVVKNWNDTKDHSGDHITVYLTVEDPDPTQPAHRIREVILSAENNWRYMWTGLPETYEDGQEVVYGVYESYEEGYYYDIEYAESKIEIEKVELAEVSSVADGDTYLIETPKGYLSTTSATLSSARFAVLTQAEAMESELAQWKVTKFTNGNKTYYRFTNGANQSLNYSSSAFKLAEPSTNTSQQFTVKKVDNGEYISYKLQSRSSNNWIGKDFNQNNASIQAASRENSAAQWRFYKSMTSKDVIDIENHGFKITNTPLLEETSVTVTKDWPDHGVAEDEYIDAQVKIKLLANGLDTGRTVTLNLKNGWQDTFQGLPYKDEAGNVINYTVEEVWYKFGWKVEYGTMNASDDAVPKYSTTVRNIRLATGPELPSTGSFARLAYIYCGGGLMLVSLIIAIRLRRKKERRNK